MTDEREAAQLLAVMTGAIGVEGAVASTGTPKVMEIVNKGGGDEDQAVPMVAKVFQDAGLVTIWDRKTGAASYTSKNMLPTQVSKLGPDGKPIFTQFKPSVEPLQGTYKCWLHSSDPNRKDYDRMGFHTCNKANLLSEFHVRQHMSARHKMELKTIDKMHEDREKEIDRELQRGILRGLSDAALKQAPENGDEGEITKRRGRPAAVVSSAS